ncbi:hypothetical protein ABPG72_014470 [Tetrahymena utriculariae]
MHSTALTCIFLSTANIAKLYPYQSTLLKIQYNINDAGATGLGARMSQLKTQQNCQCFVGFKYSQGTKALKEFLEKCNSLTKLSLLLCENQFQNQGLALIVDAIVKIKNIQDLEIDLGRNQIDSEVVLQFSVALSAKKNLANLKLDLIDCSISDEQVCSISKGISDCKNLKELKLNLGQNQVSKQGVSSLQKVLIDCSQLTLLHLHLWRCKLGDEEACLIGEGLQRCINLVDLQLSLSKNHIQDQGASSLGIGLSNCKQIENLKLYLWGNLIGDKGSQALGMGLCNFENLINLECSFQQNYFNREGALSIVNGLKNYTQIKKLQLYIGSSQIGLQGAFEIGRWLSKCQNISTLDLSLVDCNIGDEGVSSIVHGLSQCPNISILELYLGENNISEVGAIEISKYFQKLQNTKDILLSLRDNIISEEGYLILGQSLSMLTNMRTLRLNISDKDYYLKSKHLLNCSNIRVLEIDVRQEDSGLWINQTQQKILYNSIYSQQILLEHSFNQLNLHMVAMKGLLNKYQSGQMIYRSQTSYTYCSYREFMFDECPKNVYRQINESIFYAQLYFVRSVFKFELLTPEQQYFIKMNEDLSFYSGAVFLTSQSDGLIQISNIYNSDTTTLQVASPSVLFNYTQASYQTCYGNQFIEPYDARCRFWFKFAKQYPGIFIYQPYNDAITGTLELSLSSQVLKDSEFYSVHTINFVMQNLVQIFNSYLSQNSFSVLFHEFNTTVLYHPLLVFYQKMTWVDVEFFNINQFCKDSQEHFELCNNQKEQLSIQVNKTLQFIKTGNYSVENQINLGQLYQQWERFGQKQVSIIFPIQSKLKGINSQQPYSNAIIMIAKVITDNSEKLLLFNLMNTNLIKVYLLIEFSVISSIIIIFIVNYGFFLIFQIKQPIELLILFLRKSYHEQLLCQISINTQEKKQLLEQKTQNSKQIIKQQIQNNKSAQPKRISVFQKTLQNGSLQSRNISFTQSQQSISQYIREEESLEQQQYSSNYNFLKNKLGQMNEDQHKSHFNSPKKQKSVKYDILQVNTQQGSWRRNKSDSQKNFSSQQNVNSKGDYFLDQNQSIYKYDNTASISNVFRSKMQNSNISQLGHEKGKTKQKDKDKILKGLRASFFEMKIIKKVFQDLESLVNYQIDAHNQNQQDSMNALFHFSKAKSTFSQLNNQTGLSRCYYNLGILYILKNDFILAQEYFEAAINQSIEAIGTDLQSLQSQRIIQQQKQSGDNYILIFFKQLLSKAYSLKQQALQLIYHEDSLKEIYNNMQYNCSSFSQKKTINQLQTYSHQITQLLIQSLNAFEPVQKLVYKNDQSFSEILKIFLFQEMIEILIYLKQSEKTQSQLFSQVKQLLIIAEQKFLNNFNLFKGAAFYRNEQVLSIQKAKQYFLFGLKEYFQNNFFKALEQFTLCLEEGTHYDPSLRKKTIIHINQLIILIKEIPQQLLKNENICLQQEKSFSLNFTILLQLDCYLQYPSIQKYLISLQQQNIFRKNDRIQILIYHSNLDALMPFININKQQDLNLIIDSLANLENLIIQEDECQKKQLNWQEALHLALFKIYEFSLQEIIQLKEFSDSKNQSNTKETITRFQYNQNNSNNQNYQCRNDNIILLCSQDQDCIKQFNDQKLHELYNIYQLKKPKVYHLKLFTSDFKSLKDQTSQYFTYQSFFDETQLTSKLNLLRNEEYYNLYQEFLAILNT